MLKQSWLCPWFVVRCSSYPRGCEICSPKQRAKRPERLAKLAGWVKLQNKSAPHCGHPTKHKYMKNVCVIHCIKMRGPDDVRIGTPDLVCLIMFLMTGRVHPLISSCISPICNDLCSRSPFSL